MNYDGRIAYIDVLRSRDVPFDAASHKRKTDRGTPDLYFVQLMPAEGALLAALGAAVNSRSPTYMP